MNAIEALEKYRLENKLKKSELAILIEVPRSSMTRILNGQMQISGDVAIRIKEVLGLDIDPTTTKISKIKPNQPNITNEEQIIMLSKQIEQLTRQIADLQEDKSWLRKQVEETTTALTKQIASLEEDKKLMLEDRQKLLQRLEDLGGQSKGQRTA